MKWGLRTRSALASVNQQQLTLFGGGAAEQALERDSGGGTAVTPGHPPMRGQTRLYAPNERPVYPRQPGLTF